MDPFAPSDAAEALITLGVDTHADVHVGVALDRLGRRLGSKSVPTTQAGYAELVAWAEGFGALDCVGVEGSGSFGVGLVRFLRARGAEVVEVNRPNRQHRRRFGKHDTADAEAAARAVQANVATGEPKAANGIVEMMRTLHVARRSAVKARTQAANQLRALLFTAPDELRTELCGLTTNRLVSTSARFRPGRQPCDLVAVTKLAMRSIARRYRDLSEEISALDERLKQLAAEAAPALVALKGVGIDTAVSLLIAAGDNPERLRSEAAFARLCGVAPIEASSGMIKRHRLNRGGNREANRALYVLVLGRMSWDERTRGYVARRTAEGKSKREIIRCLKRFVAREIYRTLTATPTVLPSPLSGS
jgi:transposase